MAFPPEGYPDWRRQAEWSGDFLVDVTGAASGVIPVVYGRFFVGQWHALWFQFRGISQPHSLVVNWFPDDGVGATTGGLQYETSAGETLLWTTANANRWVEFRVASPAGAATHNLRVLPTNRQMQRYPVVATGAVLLDTGNVNIAAGGTALRNAAFPYFGPAHVVVYGDLGSSGVITEGLNAGGVVQRAHFLFSSGTVPATEQIWLPPRRIRFTLVNFHGAAQNVQVQCVGDSY